MIRQFLLTGLASGALALGAMAHAQSVTYAPPPSEDLSRLQSRVDELERTLQQATGENERLSIELRRANVEIDRLKHALEEQQAQPSAAPLTPDQQGSDASAPPRPAPAPQAGGALGSLPLGAAPADGSQQLADAMRLLRISRYAEAQAAFAAFVKSNPDSPDTPEAQYFIGRLQLAQRNFADAGKTFVQFLETYPTSARAADAWVNMGVSAGGLGKKDEACRIFGALGAKYPRASADTRQAALREARAAGCPAR